LAAFQFENSSHSGMPHSITWLAAERSRSESVWVGAIRKRFFFFGLVLGTGFLLMVRCL